MSLQVGLSSAPSALGHLFDASSWGAWENRRRRLYILTFCVLFERLSKFSRLPRTAVPRGRILSKFQDGWAENGFFRGRRMKFETSRAATPYPTTRNYFVEIFAARCRLDFAGGEFMGALRDTPYAYTNDNYHHLSLLPQHSAAD